MLGGGELGMQMEGMEKDEICYCYLSFLAGFFNFLAFVDQLRGITSIPPLFVY